MDIAVGGYYHGDVIDQNVRSRWPYLTYFDIEYYLKQVIKTTIYWHLHSSFNSWAINRHTKTVVTLPNAMHFQT